MDSGRFEYLVKAQRQTVQYTQERISYLSSLLFRIAALLEEQQVHNERN